jgi:bifunctional NMN adenylyltransferase/nudix hydrolase
MNRRKVIMKVKDDSFDVGVIVGRFQVPELHDAHRDLIQHVCDQHGKVVIFLGVSPLWATQANPLDFEARKQMILAEFPNVTVAYVNDMHDDVIWSKRLDQQVAHHVAPSQTAVLYGGRDSFIDRYHGKLQTRELESDVYVRMSGTDVRRSVATSSVRQSPDFRAGVIWAAYNRFPTAFTTVDVAIFSQDRTRVLLGRKADEDRYRLIGGFSDPESESFADDARREVREEAGIEVTNLTMVGSYKIDDWRYRGEVDKIKTILFTATHKSGTPKPDDDIAEVRWFDTDELANTYLDVVMPNHQKLIVQVVAAPPTL